LAPDISLVFGFKKQNITQLVGPWYSTHPL